MIFIYHNEYETALKSLKELSTETTYWVVPIQKEINPIGVDPDKPYPNPDIPDRSIRFQRDNAGNWQCVDEIMFLD